MMSAGRCSVTSKGRIASCTGGAHRSSRAAMRRALQALAITAISLALNAVCAASLPMGVDDARHLLLRTSFSATAAEIKTYARLTREQAAERLLTTARVQPITAPPAWTGAPFKS